MKERLQKTQGATCADVARMTGKSIAHVELLLRGLAARRVLYEIEPGRFVPNLDPETWERGGGDHGESAV